MLGGATHAGVGGVEVHLPRQVEVAADHRALEKVDVLQRVDHAGNVVQVLRRGVAVFTRECVHHAHRRAGSAEVDLIAPGLHVVFGVLAVQHKVARGVGHRVLDQRTGKNQATGVGQLGTRFGHELDATLRRISQANVFQGVQRSVVDFEHVGIAQRLEGATVHAGAHRAQAVGQRCRTGGATGFAGTSAGIGFFSSCAHEVYLGEMPEKRVPWGVTCA